MRITMFATAIVLLPLTATAGEKPVDKKIQQGIHAAAEFVRKYQPAVIEELRKQADQAESSRVRRAILKKIRSIESGRDFETPPFEAWPNIMTSFKEQDASGPSIRYPIPAGGTVGSVVKNAMLERNSQTTFVNLQWDRAEPGQLMAVSTSRSILGIPVELTESTQSFHPVYWSPGQDSSNTDRSTTVIVLNQPARNPRAVTATIDDGIYYVHSVHNSIIEIVWIDPKHVAAELGK